DVLYRLNELGDLNEWFVVDAKDGQTPEPLGSNEKRTSIKHILENKEITIVNPVYGTNKHCLLWALFTNEIPRFKEQCEQGNRSFDELYLFLSSLQQGNWLSKMLMIGTAGIGRWKSVIPIDKITDVSEVRERQRNYLNTIVMIRSEQFVEKALLPQLVEAEKQIPHCMNRSIEI